jgi:hypothetical protein
VLHERPELGIDTRGRLVVDPLLRRVVLEVDGPHGEPVEPVLQRLRRKVAQAQHGAEAQHRDGLEVARHQLGPPVGSGEHGVECGLGDRSDEVVDVRRDDPRLVLRIQAAPEVEMYRAVDRQDRRPAEGSVQRRAVDVSGEQFGCVVTNSTSGARVTSHRPTAGTHATGASARSLA